MHTFTHGDEVFNHNSDLSGDVIMSHRGSRQGEYRVGGSALLAFVAQYVRRQRISALEEAGDNDMYQQIAALEGASDAEVLGVRQEVV